MLQAVRTLENYPMAALVAGTFKDDLIHLLKGAHSVSGAAFETLVASGELPGELFWRKCCVRIRRCSPLQNFILICSVPGGKTCPDIGSDMPALGPVWRLVSGCHAVQPEICFDSFDMPCGQLGSVCFAKPAGSSELVDCSSSCTADVQRLCCHTKFNCPGRTGLATDRLGIEQLLMAPAAWSACPSFCTIHGS